MNDDHEINAFASASALDKAEKRVASNAMPEPGIADVKHYAISFDKDGNEIRTEIAPLEAPDCK